MEAECLVAAWRGNPVQHSVCKRTVLCGFGNHHVHALVPKLPRLELNTVRSSLLSTVCCRERRISIAGAGMGAVVGMAAALQKSRTDAAASQEGARAAAAKRTRREKKRQAASMLLHTAAAVPPADAAPASDAAAAAVPHATEPSTADEAAAAAPKSKRKQRSRGCGSSDRSGGDGADSATGKPAKKRQRGQAVPVALGRDAGGEDAVAALNRSKH